MSLIAELKRRNVFRVGAAYLALMAAVALPLAVVRIVRSLRREATEHEFAAWYRPAEGQTLIERDGWWHVK